MRSPIAIFIIFCAMHGRVLAQPSTSKDAKSKDALPVYLNTEHWFSVGLPKGWIATKYKVKTGKQISWRPNRKKRYPSFAISPMPAKFDDLTFDRSWKMLLKEGLKGDFLVKETRLSQMKTEMGKDIKLSFSKILYKGRDQMILVNGAFGGKGERKLLISALAPADSAKKDLADFSNIMKSIKRLNKPKKKKDDE